MGFIIEKDWITKAGLRAVALFVRNNHRCGYVEVPKGHPLDGIEYSQHTDALKEAWDKVKEGDIGKRGIIPLFCHKEGECTPDVIFNVHGGITFSERGDGYPADNSDGWWFGFDCAHAGDKMRCSFYEGDVERTLEYVESECESLAEQICSFFPRSALLKAGVTV